MSNPSPVHTMPQPHPSYEQKDPINTRPAPSLPTGMFTRNLIGSLAASAFRLTDPDDRIGIWFVLQDLSVRTEGQFRLRFSFVNVGLSPGMTNPSSTSASAIANVNANQINTGKVPVLATCYSDVFTVFSAKKFPGVVESTHLSKVSTSLVQRYMLECCAETLDSASPRRASRSQFGRMGRVGRTRDVMSMMRIRYLNCWVSLPSILT